MRLLGKLLPKCDPVHKVTIIPRGRALGVTMSLPEKRQVFLRPRLHAAADLDAVWRAHCRRSVHAPDDDGCRERL